jgi:hypothetical protein
MNLKIKFEVYSERTSFPHPIYGFVILTAAQLTSEAFQSLELRDSQGNVGGTLIFENISYV